MQKKTKSTTKALIIFSELFGGRATSTTHYNNILKLQYTLQQPVGYFYKAPPSTMQRIKGVPTIPQQNGGRRAANHR